MDSKDILVAYSSGYGATKEVAQEVVSILQSNQEFKITFKQIDDCDTIDPYDVIVVGSSVRADRPLANARDFFSRHRRDLMNKKLALFIISITASVPEGVEIAKERYISELQKIYPWLEPVSVAAFGGKIDFSKLNPVMQSLVQNVMKDKGVSGNGSFDARNWEDIRAWAKQLALQFKEPA